MTDTLDLQHGLQYNLDQGSIGVVHLSNPDLDGQPAHVLLSVATLDGQEQDYSLAVGDRFPVGDGTWLVVSIDGVGGYDYRVRIVRVDGSAPLSGVEPSPERREQLREKWAISSDGWEQAQERVRQEEQRRASEPVRRPSTVRHTGHRDRGVTATTGVVREIRVAAVGDLHMRVDVRGRFRPAFTGLAVDADLLLLAGDLTNGGTLDEAGFLVGEVAGLPVPVVAVLGDHDHDEGHGERIASMLRGVGVRVLDGDAVIVDITGTRVGVAGVMGGGGGFPGHSGVPRVVHDARGAAGSSAPRCRGRAAVARGSGYSRRRFHDRVDAFCSRSRHSRG